MSTVYPTPDPTLATPEQHSASAGSPDAARVRAARLRRVATAAARAERAQADLRCAVTDARAVGASWGEVGAVLGVSRQGAHRRFTTGGAR